jgi:hypothetical protein
MADEKKPADKRVQTEIEFVAGVAGCTLGEYQNNTDVRHIEVTGTFSLNN